MNFIRGELVRGYYEVQPDDPVIIVLPDPQRHKTAGGRAIRLPPGKAYKPSFAYNPRHDFARKYQLGLYHLRIRTPYELADAIKEFQDLIAQEPMHALAHVGVAEALYLLAALGRDTKEALAVAYPYATEAAALLLDDLHAQAVLGVAYFLYRDVPRATAAFEKAIACDKAQTLGYGWYHAFLLATGNVTRALQLVQSQADAQPDDAYGKAIYGVFLYLARWFDDATDAVRDALTLDHNCWIAYLVQLSSTDASTAHAQNQPHAACSASCPGRLVFSRTDGALLHKSGRRNTHESLSHARERAAQIIEEESPPLWSQAAILAVAANDTDAAVAALQKARAAFDPLILFLHCVPLFDTIRHHDEFEKLKARRLEYSD